MTDDVDHAAAPCVWCRTRPAVVIYTHDGPAAFGTSNGPRCRECTPNNEYVGHDWRQTGEMRPVKPRQLRPIRPAVDA